MSNIFITSDHHFGHGNMYRFKKPDGTRIRAEFVDEYEGDAVMIERWNSVVRPQDKVYHLGDVCFTVETFDRVMPRLAGHKRLVRGNHDMLQTAKYLQHFDEIYASRVLDGMIFTHIPIHPQSLGRFKVNVHGHTHAAEPYDERYINVCVERTKYTPISLEDLKKWVLQ